MPVSEQVTGPVAVWVAVPTITLKAAAAGAAGAASGSSQGVVSAAISGNLTVTPQPQFFGWGESAPEPEFLPEYEPVMSDLRGSRKPHDKLFEGADATVTATFTLWDELVLNSMMAFTKASAPGADGGTDIGTLMLAEKRAFQMWLVFPYAVTKTFMIAANIRMGYHFYGAMVNSVRRSLGTKVNKVQIAWYCGSPIVSGQYLCYDNDMSAVSGKATNLNRP